MRYTVTLLLVAMLILPTAHALVAVEGISASDIAVMRSPVEYQCCKNALATANTTAQNQYRNLGGQYDDATCCAYAQDPDACTACIQDARQEQAEYVQTVQRQRTLQTSITYTFFGALAMAPLSILVLIANAIVRWTRGEGFLSRKWKISLGVIALLSVLWVIGVIFLFRIW